MNRLSSPQIVIFLAVFFVASLFANAMLFFDQTKKIDIIQELRTELDEKTSALASATAKDSERQVKLEAVNSQQNAFANVVEQLRREITQLQQRLTDTEGTSSLTQQQLIKTRQALEQNSLKLQQTQAELAKKDSTIQSLQIELTDAESTIQNQQRALIKIRGEDGQLSGSASIILDWLTEEFASDEQVSILQSQNYVTMDIPVNKLFNSSAPILSDDAIDLLTPLANILKRYPDAIVNIIGHADARPIVSELANTYPTNWELSSARASRIASMLVDMGVPANQLTASGKSSNEPIRESTSEVALEINRRIEIVIR